MLLLGVVTAAPIRFDLPLQPAGAALLAFSRQSGVEVLFSFDDLQKVRANALTGEFEAEEALARLLRGTGFVAVRSAAGKYVVTTPDRPSGDNAEALSPPKGMGVTKGKTGEARKSPEPILSRDDQEPNDSAEDDIVRLDRFTVTTALGRYADTNTSAGKVPLEVKDLAGTAQMLNRSLLGDLRALTLENAYRYVVGMTEMSTNSNGFSLRGFSAQGNNLQSLQVDGLPGLTTRFGSPTTVNIERVEVIKGPTSIFYGQNNPGGLINIITKRPRATRASSLFLSVATFGGTLSAPGKNMNYTAQIDSTGPLDRERHWLYRINAAVEDLHPARRDDYAHNYYLFPSLTYRRDKDTWLTFAADVTRQKRRADDGLAAPNNTVALVARYDTVYQEKTDADRDEGESLTTSFGHIFANGWTLRMTVRNLWHIDTRYALEGAGVVSALPVTDSAVQRRFRHQYNGRRYNFGDLNLYGDWVTGRIKHTLLMGLNGGIEYNNFFRHAFGPAMVPDLNLYNPGLGLATYPSDGTARSDTQTDLYNYGGYVSDLMRCGEHWRISVGFRHDQQDSSSFETFSGARRSQSQSTNLPSFGLIYQPVHALSFYTSYCQGYKASSLVSVDANGRSEFPPERSSQVETGLKVESLDRTITFAAAVYDLKKDNVLELVPGAYLPDGTAISRLVGEQETQGVELQATYLPVPHWQLLAGYTYMDARINKTLNPANINAHPPSAPRYSGNFWTRYNFPSGSWKGVGVGLGVYYTASCLANGTNDPALYLQIPAYARFDAALYYQRGRYSYALNVGNLFDRQYITSANLNTAVIPGIPRKLTFSMRIAF